MIREDALGLVYRMNAAWPNMTLSDETLEVWVEHLSMLSQTVGMDAVRELEVSSRFFPTIAEFRKAYDRAAEYDRLAKAQDRGLPAPQEPTAPKEVAQAAIEEARRSIDAALQLKPKREHRRKLDPRKVMDEMTEQGP